MSCNHPWNRRTNLRVELVPHFSELLHKRRPIAGPRTSTKIGWYYGKIPEKYGTYGKIMKNPGKILVLSQILIMKCAATQFPELQCNGARRLFNVPTAPLAIFGKWTWQARCCAGLEGCAVTHLMDFIWNTWDSTWSSSIALLAA